MRIRIVSTRCNSSPTDDNGRRTLYEEIQVPHFLQTSARGICGSGRDVRRDSTGMAGSLRGVEGVSFDIAVVEESNKIPASAIINLSLFFASKVVCQNQGALAELKSITDK
jgi:hypothetical protein